jgi:dihydroflavonol-4-reductase
VAITLVTGVGSLVGAHVARALVERGDAVRVTVGDDEGPLLDVLAGLELELVTCDVRDRRQMRRALRGVQHLFHLPTEPLPRPGRRARCDDLVLGTRIALSEALRADVESVVYSSSVAAIGPVARGRTADERGAATGGRWRSDDVDASSEAEREALRLAEQGLPVVVVNVAQVLGAGDEHRSTMRLVRRFLRREIPVYVDGAVCVVGAADAARGHLLAQARGRVGERYILGGRNFTNDQLFADLGRLSGVEPPALKLPLPAALAMARTTEAMPVRPAVTALELRSMARWRSYRSTKARRELGWRPGHHEQPLLDAIDWLREQEPIGVGAPGARQPLALRMAGGTLRRAEHALRLLAADY